MCDLDLDHEGIRDGFQREQDNTAGGPKNDEAIQVQVDNTVLGRHEPWRPARDINRNPCSERAYV